MSVVLMEEVSEIISIVDFRFPFKAKSGLDNFTMSHKRRIFKKIIWNEKNARNIVGLRWETFQGQRRDWHRVRKCA